LKKAHERGAFKDNNSALTLPVPIEVIEVYLSLLKPIFLVNIGFQHNESSIADVVPSILSLIDFYENPKTTFQGKMLANLIVAQLKKRFDYELNSNYYLVIFNIYIKFQKIFHI